MPSFPDVAADLAALLMPLPTADSVEPPEAFDDAYAEIQSRQLELADNLRAGADAHDQDPLLYLLAAQRETKEAADLAIRLVIGYARHFSGPRSPYRLDDLAEACGLTGPGVLKIAERQVAQVSIALGGRRPTTAARAAAPVLPAPTRGPSEN